MTNSGSVLQLEIHLASLALMLYGGVIMRAFTKKKIK
jgi:hypothetical protein